ncbi:MAG: response regulator [Bacteroidia bacterium]
MNNNNIRVMLVEDEALSRKIKAMLKNIGHELVGVVDNAGDGLEMFEEEKPDLLLVDIVIKGKVDGVQFARELTRRQAVPVIFITSLKDYESFPVQKKPSPTETSINLLMKIRCLQPSNLPFSNLPATRSRLGKAMSQRR